MYLLPCVIWVHVLPVHVLLHKIQMSSRLVRHVLDVVLFCCVFIKAPVLNSHCRLPQQCCSASAIPVLEEAGETIWNLVNGSFEVSIESTFNFEFVFLLSDIILVGCSEYFPYLKI